MTNRNSTSTSTSTEKKAGAKSKRTLELEAQCEAIMLYQCLAPGNFEQERQPGAINDGAYPAAIGKFIDSK